MNDVGVLLIHGFAGKRDEVKLLYENLSNKGFNVSLPCLKGHESTKKELGKAKYCDWLADCEKEYLNLKSKCNKIVVVGFSMGGLIAANLYNKFKYDALITLNTPIYYWNFKQVYKNLRLDFKKQFNKYRHSKSIVTVSSLLQFQILLSKSKSLFKGIDCNALVVQTMDDDTVHPKSSEYIYKNLCGEKYIRKINKGGHIALSSESKYEIVDIISEFIDKQNKI